MIQIQALIFPPFILFLLISPGTDCCLIGRTRTGDGCFCLGVDVVEHRPRRHQAYEVRRVHVIVPPQPPQLHHHYNSDISHHSGDFGSHGSSVAYSTATNQNPNNQSRPQRRRSINNRRDGSGMMQPPQTQQISRRSSTKSQHRAHN